MSITGEETLLHTPGPWSCAQVWRGPETKVHAEVDGRRVALAEVFTMQSAGEKEANAKLIAAAPELLKALKALRERYVLTFGNSGIEAVNARAAITKAEGRW